MEECCEGCADAFNNLESKVRSSLIGGCCFAITLLIYLAVAIEGVEPTEYAIIKNNFS